MHRTSRPSAVTRMFFYHANAIGNWRRDCVAARRGLLRYLRRGADVSVRVREVTPNYPTSGSLTLCELALSNIIVRDRRDGRVWLGVYEALADRDLTDVARVLLWSAVVLHCPALASSLVRRRIDLPPNVVDDVPAALQSSCVATERSMRRALAETRRTMHTRGVLLGGRGPAGALMGRCYVPVDVWREVFSFLLAARL